MAAITNFKAPSNLTIENESSETVKLPVASSPDMFIYVTPETPVTVTVQTTAEVAFYNNLQDSFPVKVTVATA